jgi:hypothetical protein
MLGVFFSKKIHLLGESSNNCIVSRDAPRPVIVHAIELAYNIFVATMHGLLQSPCKPEHGSLARSNRRHVHCAHHHHILAPSVCPGIDIRTMPQ